MDEQRLHKRSISYGTVFLDEINSITEFLDGRNLVYEMLFIDEGIASRDEFTQKMAVQKVQNKDDLQGVIVQYALTGLPVVEFWIKVPEINFVMRYINGRFLMTQTFYGPGHDAFNRENIIEHITDLLLEQRESWLFRWYHQIIILVTVFIVSLCINALLRFLGYPVIGLAVSLGLAGLTLLLVSRFQNKALLKYKSDFPWYRQQKRRAKYLVPISGAIIGAVTAILIKDLFWLIKKLLLG
jgi:hypothetical protein